jgi:hypothetical protein
MCGVVVPLKMRQMPRACIPIGRLSSQPSNDANALETLRVCDRSNFCAGHRAANGTLGEYRRSGSSKNGGVGKLDERTMNSGVRLSFSFS